MLHSGFGKASGAISPKTPSNSLTPRAIRTPLNGNSNNAASRSPLRDISKTPNISPKSNILHNAIENPPKSALKESHYVRIGYHEEKKTMKECEEEINKLKSQLMTTEKNLAASQAERDKFEVEVRKLTRLNENNNSNSNSANESNTNFSTFQKMTAASRELIRLEEENASLSKKSDTYQQQAIAMISEQRELRDKVSHLEMENNTIKNELSEASSKLIDAMVLEKKFNELTSEVSAVNSTVNDLKNDIRMKDLEIKSLQDENKELTQLNEKAAMDLEIALANAKTKVINSSNANNASDNSVMSIDDGSCDENTYQMLENLRNKLYTAEVQRKQLLNKLQDLRGNVRVYVRCRPFLPCDKQVEFSPVVCNSDTNSICLLNQVAMSKGSSASNHNFGFDRIFDSKCSQNDVYDDVSDLIQSCLDGYRICIFSYGQTGSGKTHTMTGDLNGDQRGIIPRAIEQILNKVHDMTSLNTASHKEWDVSINMSIIELYNEELRDLLSGGNTASDKLKISFQNGRVSVHGLSSQALQTDSTVEGGMLHLKQLMKIASNARTTAATQMNAVSSRSHVIYMVDITATHHSKTPGIGSSVINGALRLVDLAGSERVDRTGTQGDATRFKESVSINKSLSCIADVFNALNNKQAHVPFRNSKLTMLLQDCLSGDGKAVMFVNVSPTDASTNETLCSLRFASQVNQVELGRAKKHAYAALPPAPAPLTLPPPPPAVVQAAPLVDPHINQSDDFEICLEEENDFKQQIASTTTTIKQSAHRASTVHTHSNISSQSTFLKANSSRRASVSSMAHMSHFKMMEKQEALNVKTNNITGVKRLLTKQNRSIDGSIASSNTNSTATPLVNTHSTVVPSFVSNKRVNSRTSIMGKPSTWK